MRRSPEWIPGLCSPADAYQSGVNGANHRRLSHGVLFNQFLTDLAAPGVELWLIYFYRFTPYSIRNG